MNTSTRRDLTNAYASASRQAMDADESSDADDHLGRRLDPSHNCKGKLCVCGARLVSQSVCSFAMSSGSPPAMALRCGKGTGPASLQGPWPCVAARHGPGPALLRGPRPCVVGRALSLRRCEGPGPALPQGPWPCVAPRALALRCGEGPCPGPALRRGPWHCVAATACVFGPLRPAGGEAAGGASRTGSETSRKRQPASTIWPESRTGKAASRRPHASDVVATHCDIAATWP